MTEQVDYDTLARQHGGRRVEASDAVADYLRTVRTTDAVRAVAWDAVHQAKDDADLTRRLQRVPVPNEVRAQLFDLYHSVNPSVARPLRVPLDQLRVDSPPATIRVPVNQLTVVTSEPVDYDALAREFGGQPAALSGTRMREYRVREPQTGRSVILRGDSPPTEAELEDIFMKVGRAAPPPKVSTPPPAAATAGMLPPSTMAGDPRVAAPSRREQVLSALDEEERRIANDPLKQIGTGAEKEFQNSIIGAGELVRAVPGVGRVIDLAIHGRNSSADLTAARRLNQPATPMERLGGTLEQIGEFMVLPAANGGLLRRAAQEGVQSGVLSAAQGGNPVAGVVSGAAGPAVSRAVAAGAQRVVPMLREAAEHRVMQALGPTKERFKAMAARITPQILRRGLSGSREAILARATQVADDVGSQIDDALQQYGQRQIGTAPVIDALETAKDAFRTTQQMPAQQAMQRGLAGRARDVGNGMVEIDVVFEPRSIDQLTGLQGIIRELGDNATVEQLVAIRRAWDKVVDQAGGYAHRAAGAVGQPLSDQTEAWAKREATGAIRRVLASELPDLAALNREFAFWRSLDDVLTQTIQRTQPHGPGLGATIARRSGQILGAGGGFAGGGVFGALGGAAIGAEVGARLYQLLTSPRFRLLDARIKNGLADAIVSGNTQAIWGQVMRANAALMGGGALRPVPAH